MNKKANRLIHENSPYLLQHAYNPVDWYAWSQEAFDKAQAENKPLFVSIGYATCHWCHVMERESFENNSIAAYLNKHFICIKVDREERPDIDSFYMKAVQLMTGRGGWPMSIFVTPGGAPFFAGTYYPPEPRYTMPGFLQVLEAVHSAWSQKNSDVINRSSEISARIAEIDTPEPSRAAGPKELLSGFLTQSREQYDNDYGGFSPAPKFPQPTQLILLMNLCTASGNTQALAMARHTLDAIARGGIHDHAGGGFHRYSVDKQWLVPHFEKMLYDQAMLTDAFLLAFQITGNRACARIAERTAAFVLRDMQGPGHGFYSAVDADSQGGEGAYYVWDIKEIKSILDPGEYKLFSALYDTAENGNWEGRLILAQKESLETAARAADMPKNRFIARIDLILEKLRQVRTSRSAPAVDDKILTDWNSLMITSLARAGMILENRDFIEKALKAADAIETHASVSDSLYHSFRNGRRGVKGFLSDYAFWTRACIALYEATGSSGWMEKALFWHKRTAECFSDSNGGFFAEQDTGIIPVRQRQVFDSPVTSPEAAALENSLVCAAWQGEDNRDAVIQTALRESAAMEKHAPGTASFLSVILQCLAGPVTAVVSAEPGGSDALRMLKTLTSIAWPGLVIAYHDKKNSVCPLVEGKEHTEPALFICAGSTCFPPLLETSGLVEYIKTMKVIL